MSTDAPHACPPIDPGDWPQELAGLERGFAGQLNIYKVMAHHPDLLRAWVDLRAHLVTRNDLGAQMQEVAILRIAHVIGSDYERIHHVARATKIGLDKQRIARTAGPTDAMDPEDALLCTAVDALLSQSALSPGLRNALAEQVGIKGVFDLIATVGFYKTLGCLAKTFDVPLDKGIASPDT